MSVSRGVVAFRGMGCDYLAEALSLGMLLEAEGWEVHAAPEDLGFRQDTDTANAVNLHFHIRVTVGIP